MRQLDPKIAAERKQKLLRWIVHDYIRTSRPIASASIAEEAGLDLSSASIRNILKELEEEGFLHQPHTSSGRVPTDRGYRFYVDYLQDVQRLAAEEKAQIERHYSRRMEELDALLVQTSKLLSHVSRSAGLVLSPRMEKQTLKRLELIAVGPGRVLAIAVTSAGQVRHWPIRLSFTPSASRLAMLNRFLNERIEGKSIREVRAALKSQIESAERELSELHDLTDLLLRELGSVEEQESLYMEGALSLVSRPEDFGDPKELHSLMRVVEERKALVDALQQDFKGESGRPLVRVRIGEENVLPELKSLSLVTTVYRVRGQVVGVLGVMGSKRMEYSRMMALVDYMGSLVSRTLEGWDVGEKPARPERKRGA